MPDWSWKQAVAECVVDISNKTGEHEFALDQVYKYVPQLSERFPRNHHVKDKIRQVLQRLRDDDFVMFKGGGRYCLNLEHAELAVEAVDLSRLGSEAPQTRRVARSIRLRSTLLAAEIKRRYRNVCQICRDPVRLTMTENYAEGHHLKPLGVPHRGPDVDGNIIVLCPNHHVMFDRGVITIEPDTLRVRHLVDGFLPKTCILYVEGWHHLNLRYLKYHHSRIFGPTYRKLSA